jgi:hypothetical protein
MVPRLDVHILKQNHRADTIMGDESQYSIFSET